MAELSVRYASALYEISLENNQLDEYLSQAILVRDALKTGETRTIIEHPDISDREKREFLKTAFSESLSDPIAGLLDLAIRKKRERIILSALEEFITIANRHNGKVTAIVVSAVPLREEQLATLKDVLSRKMDMQVDLVSRVDTSLIGGFYVHVDGSLIDKTVINQLRDLKEKVKRGVSDDPQT